MYRKLRAAIITIVAAIAVVAPLGMSPASATDPTVVPRPGDIVGVGSDTTEDVVGRVGPTLATSGIYPNVNAVSPASIKMYAFDATGSATIVTKQGCAPITRPNGSSAGVSALLADQAAGTDCIDFARSSRVKGSNDGSLLFVPFAQDGVTWATFPGTVGGTTFNAPLNLTTAQLTSIYTCSVSNWSQVGGRNAPIEPFLPQSGSGTRSFWLGAIGVTSPGPCVDQSVQENSGEAVPAASRPNAIVPYSIAEYVAQTSGVVDDIRAGSVLRAINGTRPLTAQGRLNPSFTPSFLRQVFNVIKPEDATSVPFQRLFGRNGFICAKDSIVVTFGFAPLPAAQCGF